MPPWFIPKMIMMTWHRMQRCLVEVMGSWLCAWHYSHSHDMILWWYHLLMSNWVASLKSLQKIDKMAQKIKYIMIQVAFQLISLLFFSLASLHANFSTGIIIIIIYACMLVSIVSLIIIIITCHDESSSPPPPPKCFFLQKKLICLLIFYQAIYHIFSTCMQE